jgi:predicted small lipoprotein YifL
MQRLILALAASALFFSLTGCGQSGPLYLPGNPSRIESLPPEPTGAEQEEEEKEKSDSPPE